MSGRQARKKRGEPAQQDPVPTVTLDAGTVTAVMNVQIIVADGLVWASGDCYCNQEVHPGKEVDVVRMAKEPMKEVLRQVALALGCQVGSIGSTEGPIIQAGLPVSSGRPGRA